MNTLKILAKYIEQSITLQLLSALPIHAQEATFKDRLLRQTETGDTEALYRLGKDNI